MTITLPLEPQEEAKLIAVAQAEGLSTDALVREALERILADAPAIPNGESSAPATDAALVAAMQASPYRETNIVAVRNRPPVRDVVP
jgi:hypothetical protein